MIKKRGSNLRKKYQRVYKIFIGKENKPDLDRKLHYFSVQRRGDQLVYRKKVLCINWVSKAVLNTLLQSLKRNHQNHILNASVSVYFFSEKNSAADRPDLSSSVLRWYYEVQTSGNSLLQCNEGFMDMDLSKIF